MKPEPARPTTPDNRRMVLSDQYPDRYKGIDYTCKLFTQPGRWIYQWENAAGEVVFQKEIFPWR